MLCCLPWAYWSGKIAGGGGGGGKRSDHASDERLSIIRSGCCGILRANIYFCSTVAELHFLHMKNARHVVSRPLLPFRRRIIMMMAAAASGCIRRP